MDKEKDCIYYCNKHVKKLSVRLDGYPDKFKMYEAFFSTFNHLSVYFPDAYKHMLTVWGLADESN